MLKMNPEVKKKWLQALRSGNYTQGKGRLRDADNNFCCLGVLCNLHAQEHPEIAAKEDSPRSYMRYSNYPPPAVREWAGLPASNPTVKVSAKRHEGVANLNDKGVSFEQIADYIEKSL